MRRGRPSTTATLVACARGAAGVDPIAQRLVPPAFALLARPAARRFPPLMPLVELMRVRTAAIDDAIGDAVERGVSQLVVLGAGLCARAWRMKELHGSIVFEVDHPSTQAYKRARLEGLVPEAREARFVPVDFERDDLRRALEDAGHDARAATTWIWEGVTPYLTYEAIASTLAAVRERSSEGSTIALTYYPPSERQHHPMLHVVSFGARVLGEPFRGLMSIEAMHGLLARSGFAVADDASHLQLAKRMGHRRSWPAIDERVVVARAVGPVRDAAKS